MAKTTFSKLKLITEIKPVELTWNDQVIEVKQYISMQDKLTFVTNVLNAAADDNRFYNKGKVDMFFVLELIYTYTNISFTDKQKEDPVKIYDAFKVSELYREIVNSIPNEEVDYLYDLVTDAAKQIYAYQNSAYGIMDAMNTDYNNLDFDIKKLTDGIGNKENVQFLDEVLTKLG